MCTPCCIARAKEGVEGDPLAIGACPAHWSPLPELRRDEIKVGFQGHEFHGYLVAPPEDAGKRPVVLIVHNFQGLKFFDVQVAEFFARVGYVGVAVDLYGTKVPPDARLWPGIFCGFMTFLKTCFQAMVDLDHDCAKFRGLLQSWTDTVLAHPAVDAQLPPVMMGYCFGGVACFEALRGGLPMGGVVSLHGLLQTGRDPNPEKWGAVRPPIVPCDNKYNTKTLVLIENGRLDELVPDESIKEFSEEMDAAGVTYTFHHYETAGHGFALPASLGPPGHLHEEADRASTLNILQLCAQLWPSVPVNRVEQNAAGTTLYTE